MPALMDRVSNQEDPQIVIERLAQGRISQEEADRYFIKQIKDDDKSITSLLVEIVKSVFTQTLRTR